MGHLYPVRSHNHLYGFPLTYSAIDFVGNDGVYNGSTLKDRFCCCCYNRRLNQYRLWRLARLVTVLPAVLLFTSLIMKPLTSMFLQ